MTTLGKLLAVANVIAAAACVYLAAADWSVRQRWTYGCYRLQLMLDGLPVNAKELDLGGAVRVDQLSAATVQQIFQPVGSAPGNPANPDDRTQLAEVRRVREKLLGEVNGISDENAKRQKLAGILLPLARTLADREELSQKIQTLPIAQLMGPEGPFEQTFNRVLQNNVQGKDLGVTEQAQAVAHLLFNLAVNDAERKRVATVIGLNAYAHEADQQATAYQRMAERVVVSIDVDRSRYEKDHRAIEGELQLLARDLERQQADLEGRKQTLEHHRMLLNARVTDVKELQDQLEVARQRTKKALEDLAKEQDRLFQAEKQVGEGIAANLRLSQQIRTAENVSP